MKSIVVYLMIFSIILTLSTILKNSEPSLIFLTFLVVFVTAIYALIHWLWYSVSPRIKFSISINPDFEGNDKLVQELRVPCERIILYFCVQVSDNRLYRDNHAWISFPKDIVVDHDAKYENIEYGKRATARTRHSIGYDISIPLTKKHNMDAVFLPVVVIPDKKGDYDVKIQFWSESIKSKSSEKTVKLHVVDDNLSHDKKYFDVNYFIIRHS